MPSKQQSHILTYTLSLNEDQGGLECIGVSYAIAHWSIVSQHCCELCKFTKILIGEPESMGMARQELKVIDIFLSNLKMECFLTLFLIMIIAC